MLVKWAKGKRGRKCEASPECHPERSEMSAGGHGVEQDLERDERAAGFAMDFRGVCFAFALFLHEGYSDAIRPSVGDDVLDGPRKSNVP